MNKNESRPFAGTAASSKGWAIVTGASGGMGAVFTRMLAARGYRVLAVAREGHALESMAAFLKEVGPPIELLPADLASAQGLEAVVARAREIGDVELLVNNAGVSTSGYWLEQSPEKELLSIRVNIEALYVLTRALVPQMVERRRGGVINVASVVAFQPVPYWTTYAATKAFVLAFGEGLAHELRGTGVRVVTACPGFTRTGLYAESGVPGLAGRLLPHAKPEDVVRAALSAFDHGRVVRVIGAANRLLAFASALAPRFFVRWLMGRMFAPAAPRRSKVLT
jgi:short-subunit dehydrogenase